MLIDDHNLSPEMRDAIDHGYAVLGAAAHPMALLIGGQPLGLAGGVMVGISTAIEEAGFEAVLIAATGAGVVWARPRTRDA